MVLYVLISFFSFASFLGSILCAFCIFFNYSFALRQSSFLRQVSKWISRVLISYSNAAYLSILFMKKCVHFARVVSIQLARYMHRLYYIVFCLFSSLICLFSSLIFRNLLLQTQQSFHCFPVFPQFLLYYFPPQQFLPAFHLLLHR